MDYINAFWVGGLICALSQILLDRTKLMPGRVMVLLVCSGAILGRFISTSRFRTMRGQEQVSRWQDSAIFCGKA